MAKDADTPRIGLQGVEAQPRPPRACNVCGAVLAEGARDCPQCRCPVVDLDVRRVPATPLPPRETELIPQFDRLLVLASLLALVSLYLPWLPGLYGSVPGWKVPYATADIPLDEIRHLEEVTRPESIFLLNVLGIVALAFCRTSRHAGLRDLVATVLLVAGGAYVFVYFAQEWGWCLYYNYVGPFAAFAALGLCIVAGLLRTKFMPWVEQSRVFMLAAAAFLLTGPFLPWSLDHSGIELMVVASGFEWLGVPRVFAYLMPLFPILGVLSFASAFRPILPARASRMWRCWAVCFGLATLFYFRTMWSDYLFGWPLGSWGVLFGLTLLTAAGLLDVFRPWPFLGKLLVWVLIIASVVGWVSFLTGDFSAAAQEFFSPPPRLF